jgi:hypothetical protein
MVRRGVRFATWRRAGRIALLVTSTACGSTSSSTSTPADDGVIFFAPVDTTASVAALPDEEVAAIVALGQTGADRPPDEEHAHHHHRASTSQTRLRPSERAARDVELAAARAALVNFDTVEEAAERGYVLATSTSPGIGIHWVRWSLIREPFAPETPSMLLFDHSKSPPVLVGYSYAVQSPAEPEGFTGKSDEWHRHAGLCVALTGWVIRERSPGPDECEGSYIAGGDFWMLHAWIVPGWENRDGMFAPANPKLCPKETGPDFMRCDGN